MFKNLLALVIIALALEGCASTRPVLYPNEHFNTVGSETANRDVESCMDLAESAGASGAVGGAVVGAAGSGSAIGAATGATAGLLHWIFSKPTRSSAFENFVNRCLQERGYQTVGWD
jgi:hypothetical protein